MASHKVCCRVAGILMCGLSVLAVVAAVPTVAETTALAIREPGTIGHYVDERDLIKRINVALFTAIIGAFGPITNTACAVDVEPISKAVICGIAVAGAVGTLIYGAYKALNANKARMELDIRTASGMIYDIPVIADVRHIDTMEAAFLQNGVPVLAAHYDCFGPGCFNLHYSQHTTKGGRSLHKVSVSPRLHANTTTKRQEDEQEATNVGSTYGDYLFHDYDKGAESLVPMDESSQTFADTIENDVNNNEWSMAGIHCFNIMDTDAATPMSYGYMSINNDTPFQDPDNEDSYIAQCTSMGPDDPPSRL